MIRSERLTVVDEFSRRHAELAPGERTYRDLVPLGAPARGEQYAFEVDLDRCTGCKSCVTACHTLNGLDDGEIWRTAGLLQGGTPDAPVQQTVTSSCHHCIDPSCMSGCPAIAYEKHPVTGIVRHLDDLCIGCQYCVFMCPYDAPKYNAARGIVRKCDMCSDRLAAAEAPACVQGCPNEAIRIRVVDRAQVIEDSEGDLFLPGAPGPGDTMPATIYTTRRAFPKNLLPADFYAVSPRHSHPALVVMLVLTQLSAGAFAVRWAGRRWLDVDAGGVADALFALSLGVAALAASLFHLGRPWRAYRAILGLRTSWLSREILAFSAFAAASTLYAASLGFASWSRFETPLELAAVITGAAGVACSVMVYAATRRAQWTAGAAGFRFVATAVALGAATLHATSSLTGRAPSPALTAVVLATVAIKLVVESAALLHLRDRRHAPLKRTAILMTRELRRITFWRFVCGLAGGIALPSVAIAIAAGGARVPPPVSVAVLVVTLMGELFERHLFFAAAAGPKTPGAP